MSSTGRPVPGTSAGAHWAWGASAGPRLLLAVGLALLVGLVVHFGPARLLEIGHRLGPRLAVLLVFPMIAIQASFLLGWWFCFRDPASRPPPAKLLAAHWVGEAFNTLTLFAHLGGEPLKAQLLRPWLAFRDSAATVMVARTMRTAAQALFLAGGMALALARLSIDLPLLMGLGAFTVLLAVGVVAFARLQQRQLFSRVLGSVRWLGLQLTSAHQSAVRGLDANLREHYQNGRGRLVVSLLTQLIGFALGALEVALACRFLGEPITAEQALFTEVFGLGLATACFLVPGSLGVSEGGRAVAFAVLGLDPVTGFAVGIVRRLRDLAWAGGGLCIYALWARRRGHRW